VSIVLYLDENVDGKIAKSLQKCRLDILTAQRDKMDHRPDPLVFARATQLHRVLVSNDQDMLVIAAEYMDRNIPFHGLLFLEPAHWKAHRDSLELIAQAATPEELANTIWYLPL
jgi:predicted nuclease of predicted toxin-antitoxin system